MKRETGVSPSPLPLREQVALEVKEIIAEEVGMTAETLRDDHLLFDDLAFDSLTLIEVATELEDRFDLKVPDEAVQGLKTVGDVVAGVFALLESRGR